MALREALVGWLVCVGCIVACGNNDPPSSLEDAGTDGTLSDGPLQDTFNPDNTPLVTLDAAGISAACAEVATIADNSSDIFTAQNLCEVIALSQGDIDSSSECNVYVADCREEFEVIDPLIDAKNRCSKEIKALDSGCQAGIHDLTACIQATADMFRTLMESTDCNDVGINPPHAAVPLECGPIYACDMFKFLEEYEQ